MCAIYTPPRLCGILLQHPERINAHSPSSFLLAFVFLNMMLGKGENKPVAIHPAGLRELCFSPKVPSGALVCTTVTRTTPALAWGRITHVLGDGIPACARTHKNRMVPDACYSLRRPSDPSSPISQDQLHSRGASYSGPLTMSQVPFLGKQRV